MSSITRPMRAAIHLVGLRPIMFDRYAGDNNTELSPEDKLYLNKKRELFMPAVNIMSFLCAINGRSATRLVFGKKATPLIEALASSVSVEEEEIPFLRGGKPIVFKEFDDDGLDKSSNVQVMRHVARVLKGKQLIPNPKVRPCLNLDWELKLNLLTVPHPALNQDIISDIFGRGGLVCGLGTFRPIYGRFELKSMKFSDLK